MKLKAMNLLNKNKWLTEKPHRDKETNELLSYIHNNDNLSNYKY